MNRRNKSMLLQATSQLREGYTATNFLNQDVIDLISEYDQLLADARELQKALDNWLTWENEQIAKEGPYCGKAITQLITEGNSSLKPFTKKYGSAE